MHYLIDMINQSVALTRQISNMSVVFSPFCSKHGKRTMPGLNLEDPLLRQGCYHYPTCLSHTIMQAHMTCTAHLSKGRKSNITF